MKIIGLTGGIGSGKSTIAKEFISKSVPVYDSDLSAKNLMISSKKLKSKLIECFGYSAYTNGSLNKKYISNLIFNDRIALNKINSIVHPEVFNDFQQWKSRQNNDYVIYESALVFESGSYKLNDYNILVTSELDLRIERIIKRDNIKKDECYPTTLVTTSERDDRVVPSHSFKFTAKLQEYQGCENPILLRTEGRAGHGAGTPKDKQINQIAEIYGYALSVIKGN